MSKNSYRIFSLAFAVAVGAGLVMAGTLLAINVIQWWGYIVGWVSVLFLVIAVLQSASGDADTSWTWNRGSGGSDSGHASVPVKTR